MKRYSGQIVFLIISLFAATFIYFNTNRISDTKIKDSEFLLKSYLEHIHREEKARLADNNKQLQSAKELVSFGKMLFFDENLSKDKNISCASCHVAADFFQKASGPLKAGERSVPTVVNSKNRLWLFWDGSADSLEAQLIIPLESEKEHNFSRRDLFTLINSAEYKSRYESIFGDPQVLDQQNLSAKNVTSLSSKAAGVNFSEKMTAFFLATLPSTQTQFEIFRKASSESLKVSTYLEKTYSPLKRANSKAPVNTETALESKVLLNVAKAISAYERTLVHSTTDFHDFVSRFVNSENMESSLNSNFNKQEYLGMQLFFGKARCVLCHSGTLFSNEQFHNIGLAKQKGDQNLPDLGRYRGIQLAKKSRFRCKTNSLACRELKFVDSELPQTLAAFKTPSLINVSKTGPYMHDHSVASLHDVVLHYENKESSPALGEREDSSVIAQLTSKERESLVAFLKSLDVKGYVGR